MAEPRADGPRVKASSGTDGDSLQQLGRGLAVLSLFAGDGAVTPAAGWSQSEISRALSLAPSVTHRLLGTLCERQFLVRDIGTRRFRLGPMIARLGVAAVQQADLVGVAKVHLLRLRDRCKEDTFLSVPDGDAVVTADVVPGPHLLRVGAFVGMRLPLHCTASGKCLLAWLDESEAKTRLGPPPYERRTRQTHTTWTSVARDLVATRRRGYAFSDQESEIGLMGYAAPVYDARDMVVAAIAVSLPQERANPDFVQNHLLPNLLTTARMVSRALGASLATPTQVKDR